MAHKWKTKPKFKLLSELGFGGQHKHPNSHKLTAVDIEGSGTENEI